MLSFFKVSSAPVSQSMAHAGEYAVHMTPEGQLGLLSTTNGALLHACVPPSMDATAKRRGMWPAHTAHTLASSQDSKIFMWAQQGNSLALHATLQPHAAPVVQVRCSPGCAHQTMFFA